MPPSTMQELQSAISELDQAIFSHEQWYKSLLRILISRVPANPVDLRPDAHQHCRFGQWYGNVSTVILRDHPAFISLGDSGPRSLQAGQCRIRSSRRRQGAHLDHAMPAGYSPAIRPDIPLWRRGVPSCMPGTTPDEAREVAGRMCHAVAAQRIQPDGSNEILQVTASLGLAMLDPSRSVEASIESADKTMYKAKKSGRNRMVTEY